MAKAKKSAAAQLKEQQHQAEMEAQQLAEQQALENGDNASNDGDNSDGTPQSPAPSTSSSESEEVDVNTGMEAKAAVGSIVHLLSTTFKEIYSRTDIEEPAPPPPPTPPLVEKPVKSDENDNIDDGENSNKGDEDNDNNENTFTEEKKDDNASPRDDGDNANNIDNDKEHDNDSPPSPAPSNASKLQGGENEEEETPWHLVRFKEISERLSMQHEQADNLLTYLTASHAKSEQDDMKSDHELKQVGLIQNAHIPMKYSTLDVNKMFADEENAFGAFATHLVGARQLVQDNHDRLLRVSGTLPMSAVTSRTARKIKYVSKLPGYLKQTATNEKRSELLMSMSHAPHGLKFDPNTKEAQKLKQVTFSEGTKNTKSFNATQAPKRTYEDMQPKVEYKTKYEKPPELEFVAPRSGSEVTRGANRLMGTGTDPPPKVQAEVRREGEQWDLDMQVLDKMGEKLHYLKNPRFDKRAINNTRVLTRPLATEADLQEDAFAGKAKHPFPNGDHNYFVAQPSVVEFLDYAVGGVYEKTLYLRNSTAVARGITILPPATQFFSFTEIKYPSKMTGQMAPGMAAKITIKFTPDSLGNYEDVVTAICEGGRFQVKIWAHRPPPKLSIPTTLNVGACLVGDAKGKTFHCKNLGGKARFRLMLEEDYPMPQMSQDKIPSLSMPPFTLYPTAFDLDHGEAVTIHVDYVPLSLGNHSRNFVIICDNCHVIKYTLAGSSELVSLNISSLNGVDIADTKTDELSLPPNFVDFDTVTLKGTRERIVEIANDTPLDLAFRWDLRNFVPVNKGKHNSAVGWGGRPRSRQLAAGAGEGRKAGLSKTGFGDKKNMVLAGTEEFNDDPEGFDVEPKYGVFPANSKTQFTLRYSAEGDHPSSSEIDSVLVVEGVPPSSIPSEEQDGLLAALAANGHGKFLRMQAWFKKMDKDGGGTVDKQELHDALEEMGLASHKKAIREVLEVIDTDGDGEISITEFMEGMPEELEKAMLANLDTGDIGDIQDSIRKEVDCLALTMRAASEYVRVACDPVDIVFPGTLTAGVVYTKQLTISNTSDIFSEFEFGDAVYEVSDTSGGRRIADNEKELPSPNDYIVEVSPKMGVLNPLGSETIVVTFSAKLDGRVDVSLPLSIQGMNKSSKNNCVKLSANIAGPRLRVDANEVDFGLVAVGGDKQCVVKFMNEGDVPMSWGAFHLEAHKDEEQEETGVDGGMRGTCSSRASSPIRPRGRSLSVLSKSTGMMSKSSFLPSSNTTNNSPSSFKIESPFCKLEFEPAFGTLGPKESGSVVITCLAGKLPQRLRATLGFMTADDIKEHDYETQYVGVRAEVQSPKVYLNTHELNLGVTYVDVPVVRRVVLKNLSNLNTKFKWERPAGATPSFTVEFEPPGGTLSSKETREVKVTYTAKTPGMIDDVFACRIFGMAMPLGFSLKTISKGVVVGYERLQEGQNAPEPLCSSDAPQFLGNVEDVPTPEAPPLMHIAGETTLFSRKTERFVLRNFSAVPAKFKIYPRTYLPAPKEEDEEVEVFDFNKSATASKMKTGRGGKKLILGNAHETTNIYATGKGRDHTRAKLEAYEDRNLLRTGKGYAIAIEPNEGNLVPWGVTEITVSTYNDMPATYKDDICCDVEGAPLTRLDFKAKVVGCPLSLRKESCGLDMMTDPSMPNMKFGEVAVSSKIMKRTVVVKNSGPIDAQLSWDIRESGDNKEDNRVVAISIDTEASKDINKPVKVSLGLYEKPVFESPYTVSPVNTLVPKHGESIFTLTLNEVKSLKPVGDYKSWSDSIEALCVADVKWLHGEKVGGGHSRTTTAELVDTGGRKKAGKKNAGEDGGGLERETFGAVKLNLSAQVIQPWLYLDKRRHGEKNALTDVPEEDIRVKQYLKFSISAMELKEWRDTGVYSDAMEETFLMTNTKSIPLEFAINSSGPFKITKAVTLALPHPFASAVDKVGWNVDQGRLFNLPPGESVEISVAFLPNPAPLSDGSRDDVEESKEMKLDAKGRLKILFSTGQEQFVDFKGEMMRPIVLASPSDYHFGVVHTEKEHELVFFVCNPTSVDANWKITHVPAIPPKRARMVLDPNDELNQVHLDAPEVFAFSDMDGIQPGPTLPIKSSGAALPNDQMRLKNPVHTKTPMSLTWKSGDKMDLTLDERMRKQNDLNKRQPRAVTVVFKPVLNKRYRSRFRLEVEEGSGFDILLTGEGTYEENKRKALPYHV